MTLVTGGAGFIGSHIVDKLVHSDIPVRVLDNLSSGSISNLPNRVDNNKFLYFIHGDLNNKQSLKEALKDVMTVFHMAAYSQVRQAHDDPAVFFKCNIKSTYNLLEELRKSNVKTLLFASSSTVYGEPTAVPTPENYGPTIPISHYGASKLACEAMVCSYCNTYGFNGQIFRLANIIGSRGRHGVIWDFIKKLRTNSMKLQILGDGWQSKSYLHISDCVECLLFCLSKSWQRLEIFNVGNYDQIDVMAIAETVCNVMNLRDVELYTLGGADNGRGWIGDVRKMLLDMGKLKKLGWSPKLSSLDAVALASRELMHEYD